jgi:hypothetical protein
MKKENMKTAWCILGIFLLIGCTKNDPNCTPSSQSFTFQANRSVDTSGYQVSATSGNNIVFKFQHNYEHCEGVVGAAISREIYFEVPSTQSSFQYSNESLLPANVFLYLKAPISPSLRITRISQGSIHGTQINTTKWHITASLISGTETINFDEDFIRIE